MKERPIIFSTAMVQAILDGRKTQTRRIVKFNHHPDVDLYAIQELSKDYILSQSPYGKPGDLLWVRETYSPNYFEFGVHGYKSEWSEISREYLSEPKWKPSIHMPKEAARIWLRVSNVRVERLHDISRQDAISEGVEFLGESVLFGEKWGNYNLKGNDAPFYVDPRSSFFSLWAFINGHQSYLKNPWVWVIEFELISKTGRP